MRVFCQRERRWQAASVEVTSATGKNLAEAFRTDVRDKIFNNSLRY